MVKAVFYRGHDATAEGAVAQALAQIAPVMMRYPSLVVDLEALNHSGQTWDADVRVLAIARVAGGAQKHRRELNLEPDDPEHLRSGNSNEWRPIGMKHDGPIAAFRFSNAAMAGELPQLPLEDIVIDGYELARASEPELRKMMDDLEEARVKAGRHKKHDPEFDPD